MQSRLNKLHYSGMLTHGESHKIGHDAAFIDTATEKSSMGKRDIKMGLHRLSCIQTMSHMRGDSHLFGEHVGRSASSGLLMSLHNASIPLPVA